MKKYSLYNTVPEIWLEQIPTHWSKIKIKYVFSERSEKGHPNKPLLVAAQNMGVVPKNVYGYRTVEAMKDLQLLKLVKVGDFVISLRSFQGGIEQAYYEGIISPAYTVMIPNNKIESGYFRYLAKSTSFIELLKLCVTGIREGQNVDYKKLKNHLIPIPPRDEQDQIVRFLDWKVSSINRLINIKKKEISKLEELKRTKIATVVMGKLADEQKETAISWVHSIPTHWQEASLIQVAEEQLIKNVGLTEKNLLSLSYGKIINKDIEATEGLLPASFESYQIVNDGNIILRLTDLQNDHRSLRTGLVTQKGIITSAYTCLKTRGSVLPEYLQLQLHIADLCKVFYGMGGGVRQSIGFKEIRKLIIALPSLEEQEEIVEVVHKIENPINELIKKYKDFILLLENLKSRIISDAVTGQIDVRDVKIPSFDMVEEDLDEEKLENNDETEESGEVE